MSAPQFTPGPWRFRVANATYPNVCDIEAGPNYFDRTLIGFTAANCEQSPANANLIAAAPELYEALDELCQRIGGRWFLEQNWAEPLAALAKARGEQVQS